MNSSDPVREPGPSLVPQAPGEVSTAATQNTRPGAPAAAPERIAIVSGDRVCGSCGFNLHGQHVVREEHYAMLMIRCPECGQVASLHEYPVLGAWARRLGMVLAALWLFVMVAAVAATIGALTGGAFIVSQAAVSGVTRDIASVHAKHVEQRLKEVDVKIARLQAGDPAFGSPAAAGATDPNQVRAAALAASFSTLNNERQNLQWIMQNRDSDYEWLEQSWWEVNRTNADFARSLWKSMDWRRLFWATIGAGMMPLIAGVFWAVSCPRWRGRSLLVAWVVLTTLGVLGLVYVTVKPVLDSDVRLWGGLNIVHAVKAAREIVGPMPSILAIAIMSGVLLLAMRYGRAWARLAIRTLLPPRLRVSFAYLWWCDGKEMPRTRAASGQPA